GQVAFSTGRPRTAASSSTVRATPWAENTVTALGGTSERSSTKIAPLFFRLSTTYLLCTISCRTYTGGPYFSSARSTISIARTTPAQKPRGWARNTSMGRLLCTLHQIHAYLRIARGGDDISNIRASPASAANSPST